MDSDDVLDIAELCRDSAPQRPRLSMKKTAKRTSRAPLTSKNLATLVTHCEETIQDEEEAEEGEPPAPKKKDSKKTTKKAVCASTRNAKPVPIQQDVELTHVVFIMSLLMLLSNLDPLCLRSQHFLHVC